MFTVFTKANSLMPAGQFQVKPEQIICNDVALPAEIEPGYMAGYMKLWVIGGAHGVDHCIFASCEQNVLDASVNADVLDWCLSEDQDYDNEELTALGNAGELFDLSDVWMAEVDFKIERDFKLIIKLIRAQEQGRDNLDF